MPHEEQVFDVKTGKMERRPLPADSGHLTEAQGLERDRSWGTQESARHARDKADHAEVAQLAKDHKSGALARLMLSRAPEPLPQRTTADAMTAGWTWDPKSGAWTEPARETGVTP